MSVPSNLPGLRRGGLLHLPRRAGRASALLAAALLAAALLVAGCPDGGLTQVFPDIRIEAKALDFGTLPVLNVAEQTLSIENQGRARLALTSIRVEGADAAAFGVGSWPERLGPGDAAEVSLTFRPEEEREYFSTLIVESDDPDTPRIEIPVHGEGKTKAAIEVDPTFIHFGIVGEGTTAVESLIIRSVGTAPLIVEEVHFGEGTPPQFEPVGSWSSGTLEPGEEIPLSVAFKPVAGQEQLTGSIVIVSTDPERREVTVDLESEINRAPIADCGPQMEIESAPGDVVHLDGSASDDPDGHLPLSFAWRILERPIDSNTELSGADTATPSLELDVPGTWEVALTVADALGVESIEPCKVKVRAVPAEKLYVELVWDHPITDLDLHFLAPGGMLNSGLDCYWGNPNPDFGTLGFSGDDPALNRDDLAGFGPEIVTYPDPPAGTYRVVVDYAKANGAADPVTEATVRIYQFGVIVAEYRRVLDAPKTLWNVAAIDWPGGDVSTVDTVVTY
ncbi:MAG: choice-of-anchor D domain-containing protein [Deltaproteobacteria bacterium]|nr:MAG: choice-of-anchor D domain-containing protein [Deltaproteobacteria bacterium]